MDEASKRKRISDPEGEPNAKRPAAQLQKNNTFASKDPRAALAEVYAAYDALHRNTYTSDDDIKAGEAHFAILVSAVQGNKAVQRLAIRLLPKFAPRFPSLISEAARALQGLSSLNLNNNGYNAIEDDVAGSDTVSFESLEGLKRMLLTTCTRNNNNSKSVSATAAAALHFALHQQLHPTITEERRAILHEIAKAAFIACPRAVLSQIVEISSGKTEHTDLRHPALQFVEKHLLVRVQDQELDIKESLFAFEKKEEEGIEEEEQEEEETQIMVLLAALRKKEIDGGGDGGGGGIYGKSNDGYSTWAVSLLQSVLQHSRSLDTPPATLIDGLKAIIETLCPGHPFPSATAGGGGGSFGGGGGNSFRERRRSSGSPSPKPTTHASTRGTERGSSYGGKSKYTPPLQPSGSSRPPRRERGSSAQLPPLGASGGGPPSKWSSRGPTPTLEEGELGELDEGEVPPSQKQQSRRSRSPGRGDRVDRIDRGRRRGSPSPFPPSHTYRDRRDDRDRSDRERERGGDRGEYRGPPRDRDMRNLPPPSNQKVSGRGMPPLEYAGKALWVGQVPLGHSAERDLVDAFARYGQLTSHHIIARSSCAFINYVDVECAIEARERLDGARVAGSTLVVEFKGEKKYWESREGRERDRERERERERGGGGYRGDGGRERDRDRGEYDRGGEYPRQSPFTGGGVPPMPPRRGRGSRSRRDRKSVV